MQKVFTWLIVGFVIVAGAWFLFQKMSAPTQHVPVPIVNTSETSTPDEGSDNPIVHVITYTENGYEPMRLTVKKGEMVRFVNNVAAQETWPASAVHPTHGIYPEKTENDCLGSAFDACRGLKLGESWNFTFNVPGEWRFHDHLHPSKTGVVIVTE